MKKRMRIVLFIIICLFLVFLDQYTKAIAVRYLKGQNPVPVISSVLYFLYIENRGAAFGFLQGAQIFFYLITIFVLFLILYVLRKLPDEKRYVPLYIVCVLIFSGAIGNFIDRVRQQYVVDFIYFKPIDFPVFNVADIYVTTGAIIMVLLFLLFYNDHELDFVKVRK